MAGLHTRATRRLEGAIAALKGRPDTEATLAEVCALAGLVRRADADWATGSRLLLEAGELGRSNAAAPAWLALGIEALCASGQLVEAGTRLETLSKRFEPASLALCNAILHLARGNLSEALALALQDARTAAPSPWAGLVVLEARLDLSRPMEAEADANALFTRLEAARVFDEAWVRALTLKARLAVELNWVPGAEAPRDGVKLAAALVHEGLAATVNFPRHRGCLLALHSQIEELAGRSGARSLSQALASLEKCQTPWELGRVLARQAAFRVAVDGRQAGPLIARGRDTLTRMKADARSMSLAQIEAGGQGASSSVFNSQSILQRSMIGGAGTGDDVELQAVFAVNEAITSVLELNELMQRILDEAARVMKAERGALVRLLPDGSLVCVAGKGVVIERVKEGLDEISFTVVKEVAKTGKAVLTDNAQLDERLRGQASVMSTEVRSLVCAPLKTSKGVLGVLYLDSTLKARIFKADHKELLAAIATQAAVALENALSFAELGQLNATLEQRVSERTAALEATLKNLSETKIKLLEAEKEAFETEVSLARRVQQSIIPRHVVISRPGANFIGYVEPAANVGGDFWTWMPLPNQHTLLLVGDVTGHGLAAGMLTTVAKACCDTMLRRLGTVKVEELLATMSDVIYDSAGGELAMTAFAVVIDPAGRTLRFASAGHNPPLYLEAGGGLPKLGALVAQGDRLGEAVGITYEPHERTFAAGDRMLIFTDGLVECRNAEGAEFGTRRLNRLVLGSVKAKLAQQLETVLAETKAFFGAEPHEDDITALMVELT
jgi:serine phosphatase RsbU (regulator of sigma subunit)